MAKTVNIAINGFGRIGRNLFRLLIGNEKINVVAINDIADTATLVHLLKYDSTHGILKEEVSVSGNTISVNGNLIKLLHFSHPKDISWQEFDIDLVIEASGRFKTSEDLQHHLKEGVKKVILTVPPTEDEIKMVVMGVNDQILDGSEKIISNASCTTNNAAPMLKLLDENFGVEQAYITTVHSYTTDQSLQDKPHRDLRRSRAAAQSIIPTTTGAAKALTRIFPSLNEVIGGCGIRVPVINGSLTDMTVNVKTKTSIEEINKIFKNAANGSLKNILSYTEDPIVSVDIIGNSHSCIFDAQMTSVIGGKLIKIIGWYDNEIGYSSRLIDLISAVNEN